jgi:hypothetical protein
MIPTENHDAVNPKFSKDANGTLHLYFPVESYFLEKLIRLQRLMLSKTAIPNESNVSNLL